MGESGPHDVVCLVVISIGLVQVIKKNHLTMKGSNREMKSNFGADHLYLVRILLCY